MKKFFLTLSFFAACIVLHSNVLAQSCGVGSPTIYNVAISETADSCFATFDLSFSLKANQGNKFVGISLWMASKYVEGTYSKVPSEADLSKALGSIVIDNGISGTMPTTLSVFTTYPFIQGTTNKNVKLLQTDGLLTRTFKTYPSPAADSFYFNLTNIKLAVAKNSDGTCPIELLSVKGDLWSSNTGNSGPNAQVQCFSRGAISFSLGNPIIENAIRNCTFPRSLDFEIKTSSTIPITVTYKIYKDDGATNPTTGELTFNSGTDKDVTLQGTAPITDLSASNPYKLSKIDFLGSNQNHSSDGFDNYWVVVYYTPLSGPTAGQTYSVTSLISNECPELSPLPVTYKSFVATRSSNSQVVLEWETAMEENNRGFHVQRNIDGNWKNIGFVFSQADGGNSTSTLKYAFKDANSHKGISQYRVLQVDMDGKGKYSEVRAIRGEEMAARLTLFPNPSSTGAFTLLFEDAATVRDVTVTDVSGRAIKQYKSISSNTLSVEGLADGFYTVQVLNRTSGTTTVEKVIIKKR